MFLSGCGRSIECAEYDELVYFHGNSSGPCTDTRLTVDSAGNVTFERNMLNSLGESTGAECLDAETITTTVPATDARALLDRVCQSYNDTYTSPDTCDGGWQHLTFRQGSTVLEETDNLSCGGGVTDGLDALREFETGL